VITPVIHSNLAQCNQLRIVKSLGFGIHGSVFAVENKPNIHTAVKYCAEAEPFLREFEAYCRLDEYNVIDVCGFNVPLLLAVDQDLRILEMTLVDRPFVLDFGGAYLDVKPTFMPEIWEHWEAEKREQYGGRRAGA